MSEKKEKWYYDTVKRIVDTSNDMYEGFEMERTPIQLVNYHENCPL